MRTETTMNFTAKFASRTSAYVAAIFLIGAMAACTPSKKSAEENGGATNSSAAKNTSQAASATDTSLDLNCVIDHIQNPTDSFHYSYKKTGDNLVDEEADITPQLIDGSFTNGSGTHPVHSAKTDSGGWQMAWSGLMGISGMSSTIALVNHSSAMLRQGPESVNGYDAVKYSVDTTQTSGADASLYKATLGDGGFEKGTIWVGAGGCPVKLSLDSEMHLNNGSVDKVHYEESMTKK
jgi:hypothetical protein